MSDTDQDKPVEEETSQTETQETEAEVEAKSNADESVDKPEDESADGATKSNAEAAQDDSAAVVKSGIADGSKSKSQAPGDAVKSKSGSEAPKSGIKSQVKSKQSGKTRSKVEGKSSGSSQARSRSKVDDADKQGVSLLTRSELATSVDCLSGGFQASGSVSGSSQKEASIGGKSGGSQSLGSGSQASGSVSGGSMHSSMKSRVSNSSSRSKTIIDLSSSKVGFLGAGRMTESIVKGLLKADKVKAKQLYVAAKTSKNLDTFKVQGIATTTRSYDLFGKFDCDIVFLNVHGFVVRNCFKLGGTRPCAITTNYIPTRKRSIFILSLIGGVPLADVKTVLLNPETANKYKVEMHRVVLNTSVAYGLGLGVLDVELDSKKCNSLVRDTLKSLAKIEFMEPDQMDAACSLIGNGMAFVYYFISALADGGFKMGLAKAKATKLATKAVQCAAQCLLETNKNPGELRDSVISPSGGAIYGIHVLEQRDCASGIHAAVEASYRRIKELVEVDK